MLVWMKCVSRWVNEAIKLVLVSVRVFLFVMAIIFYLLWVADNTHTCGSVQHELNKVKYTSLILWYSNTCYSSIIIFLIKKYSNLLLWWQVEYCNNYCKKQFQYFIGTVFRFISILWNVFNKLLNVAASYWTFHRIIFKVHVYQTFKWR